MINQLILVGRLTSDLEINEVENGTKKVIFTIAVPRDYKNSDGAYETDFISCSAFGNVAESTSKYCMKGNLVGIKGRVQSRTIGGEITMEIIADKVTFLTNRKKEEV